MGVGLRVGVAEVDITPPLGLAMDGYMARTAPSDGILDPLVGQVLVLETDAHRAAILTLDLMAVSRSFTDGLRASVASLIGTTSDAVLVAASHTHAGPAGTQDWFPVGEATRLDPALTDWLQQRLLEATRTAVSQLCTVTLSSASCNLAGFASDRNLPDALIDRQTTVLRFDDEGGQPVAVLFHYPCHPTVLSASNTHYSADFVGAARRFIRSAHPSAVPMYLNGAAGNISTRFQRRDQSYQEVARLGELLGAHVVQLLGGAQFDSHTLASDRAELQLPLRAFEADARALAATGHARFDTVRSEGLAIETDLKRVFAQQTMLNAEVCGLALGPWKLLTIPGEAFSELALRLRELDSHALIVGYANDYLGYFPTQRAINDNTYEALSSPYDARAHERLFEALSHIAKRLILVEP
jgi:hypothetical protein